MGIVKPELPEARLVYLFGFPPNLSTIAPPCGESERYVKEGWGDVNRAMFMRSAKTSGGVVKWRRGSLMGPENEVAMDGLLKINRDELVRRMREDFERTMREVADAVNDAAVAKGILLILTCPEGKSGVFN
jgi:hypothetical protein